MATRSITEQRDGPTGWKSDREEVAPSTMQADEPTVARFIGMVGASLLIFGSTILVLQWLGWRSVVTNTWVTLALATGIVALLFHAVYDRDIQFRRAYLGFGMLLLLAGVILCSMNWLQHYIVAAEGKPGDWFTLGVGCLLLAILFVLAPLRYEDSQDVVKAATFALGSAGLAFTLVGFGLALLKPEALAPFGVVLPLLGLFYLVGFASCRGNSDDLAYATGLGLGLLGAVVFLVAAVRSLYPVLLTAIWPDGPTQIDYFIPTGILLLLLGALYILASILLTSDTILVVLTRRELGSYFYSPIFYFVLLAFTMAHWVPFFNILVMVQRQIGQPVMEPIVQLFLGNAIVVICNLFLVPAITMRLLSEEQRSGTLEVLLTAPVSEPQIVLSKFFAGWILYLLLWLPAGTLLLCLYLLGGSPFDFKPLLSFGIALLVTGASFVALGLLCSSLARDQITSGVLCFVAMLVLTLVFIFVTNETLVKHFSYWDLWRSALQGKLVLRTLLFPLSLTVFCLFLTVKVLEARKWK